eukprot:TRINITY_DN10289_c0_g1_i1.p1 TRINITY_DN10289_c0_g1~~TRINITY_DN10289_c0_g1_i1.p1  ORF type:complete len:198 (-),score=70.33 TRINITY_DN10289_c0_g1_i1:132-725(-)
MMSPLPQEEESEDTLLATLDEPVATTLMRDVRQVGRKMRCVLAPTSFGAQGSQGAGAELRDWDLWGPLALCLTLACVMSSTAPESQSALVFASVFVIVWCGAAVVTGNVMLLGGRVSFFQAVCVLGYCVLPLVVAAVLALLWGNAVYRCVVVGAGFVWATGASVGFMGGLVGDARRVLAVYPVFLFYVSIAWMILIQ